MKRMKFVFSVLAIIGVGLISVIPAKVMADEPYPTRPIQVIVPFPPGAMSGAATGPPAFSTRRKSLYRCNLKVNSH